MSSDIKFEVNKSEDKVNFLDVTVSIGNGLIQISVYTKSTDAHLFLNSTSCHPDHVIRNLPKGQFIRYRRICSNDTIFNQQSRTLKSHFLKRGYTEKHLNNVIDEVGKLTGTVY